MVISGLRHSDDPQHFSLELGEMDGWPGALPVFPHDSGWILRTCLESTRKDPVSAASAVLGPSSPVSVRIGLLFFSRRQNGESLDRTDILSDSVVDLGQVLSGRHGGG